MSVEMEKCEQAINLSLFTQHFVPQAPQSCTYRRTEYIQSAIPPALKCLRNGEENE